MKKFAIVIVLCCLPASIGGQPQSEDRTETCIASQFAGPSDKWAGEMFFCTRESTRKPGVRGVAHRWLPCGTRVEITNLRNNRSTVAEVIDRGPYGAVPIGGGRWRVMVRLKPGYRYRGCLDMTPPVRRELLHNGFERVQIRYRLPRKEGV